MKKDYSNYGQYIKAQTKLSHMFKIMLKILIIIDNTLELTHTNFKNIFYFYLL